MSYNWKYTSVGGVVRVNITSGEDLRHLGELDRKLWTVLGCPVNGLAMDSRFLGILDADKDGVVHVDEVVAAANWLTSVIKDSDSILTSSDTLRLDNINVETEAGKILHDSARRILRNLGLEKDEITVAEACSGTAIFAGTALNGDGVITALSTDDAELKQLIADCASKIGGAVDRSGETGVTADQIEAFYKACADYAAWQDACTAEVLPFGADTEAANAACEAVNAKIADFFTRCKLLKYDETVAASVAVTADSLEAVANCPIARPDASCKLQFDAINPSWQAAFGKVKALVLDKLFPGAESITEADWNTAVSKFAPYLAWKGAKAGDAVEALGLDAVKAVLKADRKADLLALVENDKALEAESNSIDEVAKLMLLYRDFFKFLNNYVVFSDFYGRKSGSRGIFEVGQLYIDQRCCDLCIKVEDMGKHADMAGLSGMFLIYVSCTSKSLGKSMNVVAVMTDGSTKNLRPGKNGVFYDLNGNIWDASIIKIVDNPISIKHAFFAPYRKFWEFCVSLINKSATEKDADMTAKLQNIAAEKASAPADAPKTQAFDIAKFAGIFAAIGMALGYIGSVVTSLLTGIKSTPFWQLLLIIAGIMLVISGPSCFIAWSKLRKRNLGPVLNANGWAVNAETLISILFGKQLTSVASYPVVSVPDPYAKKTSPWLYILLAVILIAGGAAAVMYLL